MNINFDKASINTFFYDEKFQDLIFSLMGRWADEKEYEDIKDYALPIEMHLNKHFGTTEFTGSLKMTKRPFGFKIGCVYSWKNAGIRYVFNAIVTFKFYADGRIQWSVARA